MPFKWKNRCYCYMYALCLLFICSYTTRIKVFCVTFAFFLVLLYCHGNWCLMICVWHHSHNVMSDIFASTVSVCVVYMYMYIVISISIGVTQTDKIVYMLPPIDHHSHPQCIILCYMYMCVGYVLPGWLAESCAGILYCNRFCLCLCMYMYR